MHERETVMQSGENPAVLVVCVCEAIILHTHIQLLNKTHKFPFIWHDAPSSSFYWPTTVCVFTLVSTSVSVVLHIGL